jgi:tetratricopeptide (TPR) repeat protein
LTRAAIHQTQGRYDMALSDCQVLTRQHQQADVSWMGQVCEAELRSLQGRTTAAAQALALLAQRAPEAQAAWIALIRAELAVRMHDEAAAQAQFKRALQGHPDVYTLTVYVDWLLSSTTPRTQEVIQLLQGREDNDSLLLRLCIAYRQQNDPRLQAAAQQMRERFADALARGDTTHAREYGLFALYVDQNASEALRWAQQNWTLQREPIDARLLIEAARVAHQEATAQPALDVVQRWTVL